MPRLLAVLTVAVAVALIPSQPGAATAATGKCHSGGKKVIAVDRLVIYLKQVYVGCYTKTGRVTRLVSHAGYDPFAVFAHGTHATVLDGPPLDRPTGKVALTIWNLKRGMATRSRSWPTASITSTSSTRSTTRATNGSPTSRSSPARCPLAR